MRKFFGKRGTKSETPVNLGKPHMTVKVDEPVEIEKIKIYPEEAIEEYKSLRKRPYYGGQLTKAFKKWYDDNHPHV